MELQIHTLAVLHDAFQSETYSENVENNDLDIYL